ncbi:hypothetical protein RJ639_038389 [Escallonia herrerae]|uniref:Uncharacterized protein n=1 Tax=Escallonia herrerae TaxID=1293975 RepID=A0AA88WM16_9ASTE|nr:hypothetical protein RJ639_038389 [Escallonia herrerae]
MAVATMMARFGDGKIVHCRTTAAAMMVGFRSPAVAIVVGIWMRIYSKAFRKYLEIRGIKPSASNFLHEYMIKKDKNEYVDESDDKYITPLLNRAPPRPLSQHDSVCYGFEESRMRKKSYIKKEK